jgi:hypothetical protein
MLDERTADSISLVERSAHEEYERRQARRHSPRCICERCALPRAIALAAVGERPSAIEMDRSTPEFKTQKAHARRLVLAFRDEQIDAAAEILAIEAIRGRAWHPEAQQ